MPDIHLILGGARSGKSRYAEQCALTQRSIMGGQLIYIATATAGDEEMMQRIEQHQLRRNQQWLLIEEPIELAKVIDESPAQSLILIDCLTLWLSNCLHQNCWVEQRERFLQALSQSDSKLLIVSNEVGSGIVPLGALSREFADQSGWLHQSIAALCDQVDLVVAGLPIVLKQNTPK